MLCIEIIRVYNENILKFFLLEIDQSKNKRLL